MLPECSFPPAFVRSLPFKNVLEQQRAKRVSWPPAPQHRWTLLPSTMGATPATAFATRPPTPNTGLLPGLTCTPGPCPCGARPSAGFSLGQGRACVQSQQKTRCSSQFFTNLKVNTKRGHISYPSPQRFGGRS